MNTLHGVLTDKRREYLEAVREAGTYSERHGVVCNNCLRLGWVKTWVRLPNGNEVAADEIWGAGSELEWLGQRLTDEGLAMLSPTERG